MSQLLKIAKLFQKKLVFASNVNLQHLNEVVNAVQGLVQSKPLWMTAAGEDPYSEHDIESALNKIQQLTREVQHTVNEYGLNQSGYAGYLHNMDSAVNELSGVSLKTHLDPMASDKLGATKQCLERATTQYVPIGIPAQSPTTVMPEQVIKGDKPEAPAGVGYSDPNDGADPDKLNDVVDSLVEKPKPQWSGFFEPKE